MQIMASSQISKKRKFVADGVFFAELNELLTRELAEDGYSGVEVRVTPLRCEPIPFTGAVQATRRQTRARLQPTRRGDVQHESSGRMRG